MHTHVITFGFDRPEIIHMIDLPPYNPAGWGDTICGSGKKLEAFAYPYSMRAMVF